MFVGVYNDYRNPRSSRFSDCVLTLQFDQFLAPAPTHTHIYIGPATVDLEEMTNLLQLHYGIDIGCITLHSDQELIDKSGCHLDWRRFGPWIFQQILKFMAIDQCPDTEILIQDCDTFAIQPYNYFEQGLPVLLHIPFRDESPEYYQFVQDITGQPRQTPHCFVTEFMPLLSSDWTSLKAQLESQYQLDWLGALHHALTIEQNRIGKRQVWFSEYELLANWILLSRPQTKLKEQRRFEIINRDWDDVLNHTGDANFFCNYNQTTLDDVTWLGHEIKRRL